MALVRQLIAGDFDDAVALYRILMGEGALLEGKAGRTRFEKILDHEGSAVWGAEVDGHMRSIATLHVLPNMTWGGRPYALIENVVTDEDWQGRGLGRAVMQAAIDDAWDQDAYKIMLMTGKTAQARGFYEKLGFDGGEKHAMTLPGSL